jgi:K(+)-stimulated pyrophosphate-energized sodium pump
VNEAFAKSRYGDVDKMNFEAPLTSLVWLTSIVSVVITYIVSYFLIPTLGDGTLWWKLSTIITCGTLAGAIIPELVKVFTSTESAHVKEVVASSREGGASLNILSGFVAGNFSAYWLGLSIVTLMAIAYGVSTLGLSALMLVPSVFAFGLVAFGFLGMGPVTIAVDSYGPVTDNAQSVYELSVIETLPGVKESIKKDYGFDVRFERAKDLLEENDGAGNTFKATAKPVLIGTAVVGATTMIFSIIMALTAELTDVDKLDTLPTVLPGSHYGRRGDHWFTGASAQAVTTGAYAVEFIGRISSRRQGVGRRQQEAVEICLMRAKGCQHLPTVFSPRSHSPSSSRISSSATLSRLLSLVFQRFHGQRGRRGTTPRKRGSGLRPRARRFMRPRSWRPAAIPSDTSSVAMNPVIKF